MHKQEVDYKRRMYAGYPVFVVCFWDDDAASHNIAVLSSSYVLGRMVTIGLLADNSFSRALQKHHQFSVNFLPHDLIDRTLAGFNGKTAERRLNKSGFTPKLVEGNLAILEEAQISYCCSLKNINICADFPKYAHIIAHIDRLLVDDSIYNNGNIDVQYFDPSIFIGTDEGRFIYPTHKQS